MPKSSGITLASASRWFRKELRDPLLAPVIDSLESKEKEFVQNVIPERIKDFAERAENNETWSGPVKFANLISNLKVWLSEVGLHEATSLFVPIVQKYIIFLYRDHYLAKFQKLGIAEALERLLRTDLDGDGDVGQAGSSTPSGAGGQKGSTGSTEHAAGGGTGTPAKSPTQ